METESILHWSSVFRIKKGSSPSQFLSVSLHVTGSHGIGHLLGSSWGDKQRSPNVLCPFSNNIFCRTWRSTVTSITAHHRSLPWTRWNHSTPSYPISIKSILTLSLSQSHIQNASRTIPQQSPYIFRQQGHILHILRHAAQSLFNVQEHATYFIISSFLFKYDMHFTLKRVIKFICPLCQEKINIMAPE